MIEVITGPMFSGKTAEVIKNIRTYENAGLSCVVFKPEIESRNEAEINAIATHDKSNTHPAIVIKDIFEVLELSKRYDVIIIDEAQFLSHNLYRVVSFLDAINKTIIVAGLDMDYRKEPFETIANVMAIAGSITKLTTECYNCKKPAMYSQRIVSGKDRIVIGSSEKYVPTCMNCYNC